MVKNLEDHVQIYEFEGEVEKPELLAILKLAFDLKEHAGVSSGSNIAIVTDTELSSLDQFNARSEPIFGKHYLPEGVTLLYASSDTGWEVLNQFIKVCDKAASQAISEYKAGNTYPDHPFLPLSFVPSVSVRVGKRNATLTIENPKISGLKLQDGESLSLFGKKRA